MKKSEKIVFKEYIQGQRTMLPQSLEEIIPEKHLVRVINEVIDKMDLRMIYSQYKGGGTSSYHPRMLLKIVIYGYATQIYTGRKIAKALRENIHFMWLSGGNRPDFRTINRFRTERIEGKIQEIFTEVILYLVEAKYIKLETYFLDGTKIEADANKYSFVWKKSTQKYKKKLQENVEKLLGEIEELNRAEDELYGDHDLDELGEEAEINSDKLKGLAERLSGVLEKEPKDKKIKKALKKLETDYIPRLEKYEKQEAALGERNSCSKTDEDATFMCMKEDHMRNRALKPGYNVQIGTEDQFIVGFSVHQTSTDSPTVKDHLEQVEKNLGKLPTILVADAGYGSEENYLLLEEKEIDAYVKYNTFFRESRKRKKLLEKEKYYSRNFTYLPEQDQFLCPQGKPLIYEKTIMTKTKTGFESERRLYSCHDCEGCPVRSVCTQAKHGRRIQYSPRLDQYRQQAFEKLTSEEGKKLSSRRMAEPEAVFGLLKRNGKFRRFHLRGLEKVTIEWGLLSIAHNLSKIAA